MTLTIGNLIFIGIVATLGAIATFLVYTDGFGHEIKGAIITAVLTLFVCIGLVFGLDWYNTSTASGIRGYKDYKSELSNGIDRTITITAEDGREIFHYDGKVDLDMDNEGNYLRFETQDGKRYTIEYDIQDSVIIVEK